MLRSVVLGISLERKTGFELTLISRLRTRNHGLEISASVPAPFSIHPGPPKEGGEGLG